MSSASLAIVNVKVFDGTTPRLVDGPIQVRDGKVLSIGSPLPGVQGVVIDGRGGTVMPGLIDAHLHAYGTSLDLRTIEHSHPAYLAHQAAGRLGAALRRGFTTVRDVAGGDAGLARSIQEELFAAPRYLYTGPALSQTGGHGDATLSGSEACGCSSAVTEVVDGVDAVRRAVRERFRNGAHAIKVFTSGGVVSPTDPIRVPQYSSAELSAVTEEAARRGSYVAAHAYSPEAIRHSIRHGVRTIEHGNLLDADTAQEMASRSAFLVPTLAAYEAMARRGAALGLPKVSSDKNAEVLEQGRRAVEIALANGVKVGWGSDLMGTLEDEQLSGLKLQADTSGNFEALRSATSINAEIIGRHDLGTVSVGATADLLLLDGNPLDDGATLWDPAAARTVIQAGKVTFSSNTPPS